MLLSCEKHLHDHIIWEAWNVWAYTTSFSPLLVIEVRDRKWRWTIMYMCVLGIEFLNCFNSVVFFFAFHFEQHTITYRKEHQPFNDKNPSRKGQCSDTKYKMQYLIVRSYFQLPAELVSWPFLVGECCKYHYENNASVKYMANKESSKSSWHGLLL